MTQIKTPHKHAEAIKSWADGAEIEYKSPHEGSNWVSCVRAGPSWNLEFEYRVKPDPVMAWYRVAETKDGTWTANMKTSEGEVEQAPYFTRWLTDRIEYEVTE